VASAISHTIAALALGACFYRPEIPKRTWALGAGLAVLPDVDVIGFGFGIHYEDLLGHRGLTHSLCFAALVAGTLVMTGYRNGTPGMRPAALFLFLFLAMASHGILDAMTDGGLGVAFFSPFSNTRYFFPWRPIHVSPIGLARLFSARGLAVLRSEVGWIWLPSALLAGGAIVARRSLKRAVA
jgi:inner membrane protein